MYNPVFKINMDSKILRQNRLPVLEIKILRIYKCPVQIKNTALNLFMIQS